MARPALAATRALDIVSFLTEHPDDGFTMAQLTRALRLNQGSAHAILAAMTEQGFLVRHPAERTFRLGPALVGVGEAAGRANPIIGVAREELGALVRRLGLEALASTRTGADLRVVVRVGGADGRSRTGGRSRPVGQRYPLVPPIGAVLVAWSPASVQEAWIAARPAGVSEGELASTLVGVRERGYDLGGGAAARRALGVAAGALADDPLDAEREAQVRRRAGQVPTGSRDDVAMVTVPVLGPAGDAVLEVVVHGFAEPPDADGVRRVVDAALETAATVARRVAKVGAPT